MRSKLRKKLIQRFDALMKENLSQFERLSNEIIPKECSLYGLKVLPPALSLFICLQTHRLRDDFTIEIGLSDKGRWPQSPLSKPYTNIENGEFRFRLIHLIRDDNLDIWWTFDKKISSSVLNSQADAIARLRAFDTITETPLEECVKEIEPQIQDSFEKILKFALPYFKAVISQQNLQSNNLSF